MNIESLFLRTLNDLENRILSDDDYELLGSSALLRKLLVDGDPLVHQVNRKHRLPIRFEVVDVAQVFNLLNALEAEMPGTNVFQFINDSLDPEAMPGAPRRQVKLDAFLNTPVQSLGDETFTVLDVIKHQANIGGGVHVSKPENGREEALSQAEEMYRVGGLPPTLRHLRPIGRVVLKALDPLRVKTRESLKSPNH
jgi:hypothetical protein